MMNSLAPPKQKRAPARSAFQKLQLQAAYYVATFNAKLLEKPYWFWESRRGKLADRIENDGER